MYVYVNFVIVEKRFAAKWAKAYKCVIVDRVIMIVCMVYAQSVYQKNVHIYLVNYDVRDISYIVVNSMQLCRFIRCNWDVLYSAYSYSAPWLYASFWGDNW